MKTLIVFILIIIIVSIYSVFVINKYNKLVSKENLYTAPVETTIPDNKQIPVNEDTNTTQPVTNDSNQMKVLNLIYIPSSNNQIDFNETGTLPVKTASELIERINSITQQSLIKLTQGSIYHGYKNSTAISSLDYSLVDSKVYYESLPAGLPVPWKESTKRPDYIKILERENICDLVDNFNLKEVWIWGYHTEKIEPVESNMSMGLNIKNHWNHEDYGDVSNSENSDDLPICKNTYVLFNLNYGRGTGEVLENHTHHIEAVNNYIHSDLWGKFVGLSGDQESYSCGWTHYPPNVMKYTSGHDYDWYNQESENSDCSDWKPDGTGKIERVNCHTWSNNNCADDGGVSFKVWWMQNIPGLNNDLEFDGKKIGNWWELISDFDNSVN